MKVLWLEQVIKFVNIIVYASLTIDQSVAAKAENVHSHQLTTLSQSLWPFPDVTTNLLIVFFVLFSLFLAFSV